MDDLTSIEELERCIREADVFLLFLTAGYISSANCRRELLEATRRKVPMLQPVARHAAPNRLGTSDPSIRPGASSHFLAQVPMVVLRESDPQHGAITLKALQAEAEALKDEGIADAAQMRAVNRLLYDLWKREQPQWQAKGTDVTSEMVSIREGGTVRFMISRRW